MNVYQVSTLLNEIVEQTTGQSGVVAADCTNLVSIGKEIINSDTTRDKFCNALVDRIGRTVNNVRVYGGRENTLKMDTFTYGAVMQKIYVKPPEAKDAPQFNLTPGQATTQFNVTLPEVKQKLFSDRNVYEIPVTIPDYQLESAFTNAESMSAFIDSIFVQVESAMAMREEAVTEMTYAVCIGENIDYATKNPNTGIHVVNLLTDYNTKTGGSISAASAMRDYEFLQYAAAEILSYTKRIRQMSTVFNTEGYYRHTPEEYARLTVHQDFATACDVYLRSSTYHDNLVALPMYSTVPYWQGSGTDFDFDSTSTVNITTPSGAAVNQKGIIAVLSDFEAMGVMIYDKRTRSVRDEEREFTNYFYKMDFRNFVDMSENSVVFLVADAAA